MALPKETPRGELIRKFRRLGWIGPLPGRRHPFMRKDTHDVTIPNPHRGNIHISLLREILRQAVISDDEWNDA
jgi:predicted RNA binding protein YcfA (HicA-like mRNA interferase family)